jgi:hypothetical protein
MMLKTIQANSLSTAIDNNFVFLGQKISNGFNYYIPIEANDSVSTEVGRLWFLGTGKWNCIG